MKKLIIVAHPNPNGFVHRIADSFIKISSEKNHETKLINLYDTHWKQDYLMLDHTNKPTEDPKKQEIQNLISWADELVFCFPLWRFDCPAVMKNFLDVNLSSGFAYRYKKGSLLPHQLLKGKTARVFLTAGSPNRVLRTVGLGIWISWYLGRMGYVGIKLKSFTIFGQLPSKREEHQRKSLLKKVEKIARR